MIGSISCGVHCARCHHTDEAHADSVESRSLLRRGSCRIPGCTCGQYLDCMQEIDEDLL